MYEMWVVEMPPAFSLLTTTTIETRPSAPLTASVSKSGGRNSRTRKWNSVDVFLSLNGLSSTFQGTR